MNLLLDENLSPRLIPRLAELFVAISHVRESGLQQADDRKIWMWAKEHHQIIVTTDSDFLALSRELGFPPKIIHIERCNFPFRVLEDLLRRSAVIITEFASNGAEGVLTLRVPPPHTKR